MRARSAAAAVALLLAAACTDDRDAAPVPTTQPKASTTTVDLTGVVLGQVPGETTTTGPAQVGRARLVGIVTGPDGPVPGATVRVERLTSTGQVRRDLASGADGRWVLDAVPGGRYRVRAFLAPALAQTTAEVRFLADGDEHAFDLVVADQGGLLVRADIAPDQPPVGAAVNLLVLVATRAVGPDGVVRATPLSGVVVELTGLGRWELRAASAEPSTSTTVLDVSTSTTVVEPDGAGSPSQRLDAGGRARFELRCRSAGAPGLALRVPESGDDGQSTETFPLDLPGCGAEPPSTTSTSAP